jgi:molecular chaperone DnaK (HSP70)
MRSRVPLLLLLALAACVGCLPSPRGVNATSLGIDLGSETVTSAVAKVSYARRLESIVPERSGRRASPALVAFAERGARRALGADAETLEASCPACVIADPRGLLGVPRSAAAASQAARGGCGPMATSSWCGCFNHTLPRSKPATRGTARVAPPVSLLVSDTSSRAFDPEAIVAMLFEDAARRAAAGDGGGTGGEDSVGSIDGVAIAVPSWFTQPQRKGVLDAARVAGLSHARVVSEAAAVGVQLARRYPPPGTAGWDAKAKEERENAGGDDDGDGGGGKKKRSPERVVVVDVGARNAHASLIKISYPYLGKAKGGYRTRVEVLDAEWEDDGGVGGRALDGVVAALALANDENGGDAEKTKKIKKLTPKQHARLMRAAKKAKETLSANRDAVVSIVDFHDAAKSGGGGGASLDLRAVITRDAFEAAAGDIIERAAAPLRRLLTRARADDAKKKKNKNKNAAAARVVDAVEIVGGAARTPAIQAALNAVATEFGVGVVRGGGGDALGRHLNMEEATAMGAAAVALNASYARTIAEGAGAKKNAAKNGKGGRKGGKASKEDASSSSSSLFVKGSKVAVAVATQVRSLHWSPYDRVRVVNAVP